jgi:ankyrin repeat protein/nucleoside-triphosphatase THEP1
LVQSRRYIHEFITLHEGSRNPQLDIIAVHGLGSNAETTWRHKVTKKNWLKEFLPQALPDVRITTFNHDSRWSTDSPVQSLRDHGDSLLDCMRHRDNPAGRIIFIGHSFGGIIIKEALNIACERLADQDDFYRHIYKAMSGVVFLGTPHSGSPYASLGTFFANMTSLGGSNVELIRLVKTASKPLAEQNDRFIRAYGDRNLFCFFEVRRPTNFLRLAQPLVVPKDASIIAGKPHGLLNADHFGMNKFESEQDSNYQRVLWVLQDMAEKAAGSASQIMRPIVDTLEYQISDEIARITQPAVGSGNILESARLSMRGDPEVFLQKEAEMLDRLATVRGVLYEQQVLPANSNSRQWLLNDECFNRWMTADTPRDQLLILVGPPGWGKTVTSKFLLDHLRHQKYKVMAFFCKDTLEQNSPSDFVRSFLYRALQQEPDIMWHLYFQCRPLFAQYELSFTDLWSMFVLVFSDPRFSDTYLLIDGLDECGQAESTEFVKALGLALESYPGLKARIALISRPSHVLKDLGAKHLMLSLSQEQVAEDIKICVDEKVSSLADRREYPQALQDHIRERLLSGANGMFLWINLLMDDLDRDERLVTKTAVESIIAAFPSDLDAIYTKCLAELPPSTLSTAFKIFGLLQSVARPLKLEELAVLLALGEGHYTTHDELLSSMPVNLDRFLAFSCGPLVEVQNGYVWFVHQTVAEFLQFRLATASFEQKEKPLDLAKACLRYMLLVHMKGTVHEDFSNYESEFNTMYPFLVYVLEHWPEHVRNTPAPDKELFSLLESFLNPKVDLSIIWAKVCLENEPSWASQHIFNNVPRALIVSGLSDLLRLCTIRGRPNLPETVMDLDLDINEKGDDGSTVLFSAVKYGDINLVKHLLAAGADEHVLNNDGVNLLQVAVETANTEIFELFLYRGLNASHVDNLGRSVLSFAAASSKSSIIDRIAHVADFSIVDQQGDNVLHYASRSDSPDMIPKLREHIPPGDFENLLNAKNSKDSTPLFRAISLSNWTSFSRLLSYGADPNIGTEAKVTPLMIAVFHGNEDIVRALIKAGADVRAESEDGSTSLSTAIVEFKVGIANLILQEYPKDPIWSAAESYCLYVAAETGLTDVAANLLNMGMKVNSVGFVDRMPLYGAVLKGHHSTFDLLVANGAAQMYFDSSSISRSLLLPAILANDPEMVKKVLQLDITASKPLNILPIIISTERLNLDDLEMLLKAGADPNQAWEGFTPLQIASGLPSPATTKLLLEYGALPNEEGQTTLSPLNLAALDRRAEHAKLLLNAGANPYKLDIYGHTAADWASRSKVLLDLVEEACGTIRLTPNTKRLKVNHESILTCIKALRVPSASQFYKHKWIALLAGCFHVAGDWTNYLTASEIYLLETQDGHEHLTHVGNKCRPCEDIKPRNQQHDLVGVRYDCKSCMTTALCSSCYTEHRHKEVAPGCVGHDYIQIPSDDFENRPSGIINSAGESKEAWLERLEEVYSKKGIADVE